MLNRNFDVPRYASAAIVSFLVALVIIGGIRRIGNVAAKLVPFMCVVYVLGALYVIVVHAGDIPRCLALIVTHAFTPVAETGACVGVSVWFAFEWGLRRACFSNEAGEGSAAMAHAVARTEEPVREGVVAGIGPFVDTLVICTMSAMVLLMTGTWNRPAVGTVAGLEADRLTVRCTETIPEKLEPLYLDAVQVGDDDEEYHLAVHVERDMGDEPDTVTAPIIEIERGERDGWAGLQTLVLELSDMDDEDRERLAVGQPVHVDITGAYMTAFAFDTTVRGFGTYIITLGVCLFGFSTMISWSYYGEKGAEYLLGPQAILPYKFVFVIFVFLGMVLEKFSTVYDFSDATTGLMVLCNLPAVLILAPNVVRAARHYFRRLDEGEMPRQR
jgi:AGCS family alanine or glycine:cation symporter